MTSADRRASRVLLSLLCAGLTGLVVVTLWAFYAHPLTILVFGLPRFSAPLRKSLRRILRAFETLVVRAFDMSPAASPSKSRAAHRTKRRCQPYRGRLL
jgi:hypothetical protein